MALPDFIIVGAMKCGTSTLAAQLDAQPGIFMTTPKEPNFFSDDDVFARGAEWYRDLFSPAAPGDIRGEASTHYTKSPLHPDALPRMQQMLEAPKIIYLIRDPVARAVSHYIHEWTMGVMSSDIEEAFAAHPELVSYGCYAEQIAPYIHAFGAENVLVLNLETMKAQPQQVLEQVCGFLGYDQRPVWSDAHARVNVSADRIRKFPLHWLVFGNPVAAALRRTLVPQSIRDRLKKKRQMQDRPELPGAIRAELQTVFARDFEHLRALFPDRDDLHASYPFVAHG
ncbi:sulfotransferase domain-containing protein [Roseovarius sp. CAU 1744]|uniref:sulfotransferase domain-containing protein n=1 Tax=Roseovarius sp. CAU 1744 TaxID=3140368 RepID=UPI00325B329F